MTKLTFASFHEKIEWDRIPTDPVLEFAIELLDTQVFSGSVQWVLLEISWILRWLDKNRNIFPKCWWTLVIHPMENATCMIQRLFLAWMVVCNWEPKNIRSIYSFGEISHLVSITSWNILNLWRPTVDSSELQATSRFFKVTSFGPISGLFRA